MIDERVAVVLVVVVDQLVAFSLGIGDAVLVLLGCCLAHDTNLDARLTLGEAPLAVLLGIAAALAGRWALAAGQLAAIIRQRRRLDRDLEGTR